MTEAFKPDDIDALIHERTRLAIVSALAVAPELSFGELKEMLSLTDGNLSAHSRTLEEAGYLKIEKTFKGLGGSISLGFQSQAKGIELHGVDSTAKKIRNLIPSSAMPMGMVSIPSRGILIKPLLATLVLKFR